MLTRVAAIAASVLVLAACGPANPPTPTSTPAPQNTPDVRSTSLVPVPGPATNTKQGGRVITGESADARTLNPILVSDVPSDVVSSRIYAG